MLRRKIKIAILSFYSGLVSRGVETFVTELSARVKDKVDLQVYRGDRLPGAGNKLSYLFADPPSLAIKQFTQRTLSKLKDDPPDIIMALNNGWMSLLAKQFCRQRKSKLVLAGFSGIGWDDKVNLWFNPDCFLACTKFQAEWAKSINSKAKVVQVYIGVDTRRFRPEGRKFNHGLKPPIVLVVAGPERTKRVELAVKAVSKINASLLIVGRQPEAIDGLARKLLGKRYKNILVDYAQLDSVYRSVQVYTLPSVSSEAYGISILEAMASGLPVVVNDDPIRKELVGDAGIVVDPTNMTTYVSALVQALKSTDAAGYRRQAAKFSWEKISQQYLDLWSTLV
ncbi:MAG: Glycosyl transferase, group 1 [Candidatus Beckwithbacteria bacterium GW2011_GWC2_47_9]|uniref:Glycosyl transferase, group 1 n=2 Tax=Candidatus Beckwithiibacteriota TaxID=1752726 RepID=A0A0G1U1A7_9BACT|nr:MAG: Glycosyl transferase, group 1 [Candidatus Beckwithbacteria bacterium GW2011_GWC2_47_9]OGD61728.1 MAG: hypothetical protein A3I57_00980 [Candidatus Beckwithbacteria bacterium RIFCSPLOWO2_02_FULL_47_23]